MNKLIKQYFSMTPLCTIKRDREDWYIMLHEECQQKIFLSKVFNSKHAKLFPVSKKYSKTFLKKLITDIENSENEVLEELYNEYLSLLQSELSEECCYKTYYFPTGKRMVIREATSMLSSGTTGLVSWQAAFSMCEWVNSNAKLFAGKKILELGCGSGLLGIFICKFVHPSAYIFTDCHDKVLHFLWKNLSVNNIHINKDNTQPERSLQENTGDEESRVRIDKGDERTKAWSANYTQPSVLDCDCCKVYEHEDTGKPFVNVDKMDWVDFQCPGCLRGQSVDIIVGTDLVFDSSIVPSLVKVIAYFLSQSDNAKAFISTTIRNEETYESFTTCLGHHRLLWNAVEQSKSGDLFEYDNSTNIEILEITKDKS